MSVLVYILLFAWLMGAALGAGIMKGSQVLRRLGRTYIIKISPRGEGWEEEWRRAKDYYVPVGTDKDGGDVPLQGARLLTHRRKGTKLMLVDAELFMPMGVNNEANRKQFQDAKAMGAKVVMDAVPVAGPSDGPQDAKGKPIEGTAPIIRIAPSDLEVQDNGRERRVARKSMDWRVINEDGTFDIKTVVVCILILAIFTLGLVGWLAYQFTRVSGGG